jgi:hypothetical protein
MEFTARVQEANDGLFHIIPGFASVNLEIRYLNSQKSKEELLSFNEEFLRICEEKEKSDLESHFSNRRLPVLIWYTTKAVESVMNSKDFEFLKRLIELGLDFSHSVFKGTLPKAVIMCAGDDEEFESFIKLLLKGGIIIDDSENETYSTALHIACLKFDVGFVRILLKYGANPNAINKLKMMPVNLVENEENEEARLILEDLRNVGGQCTWNNYMDSF